jgi:protein TonB
MRAAQDEALARGLGFSAFAHLTVVVFALLVVAALRPAVVWNNERPTLIEIIYGGPEVSTPPGGGPPETPEPFDPKRAVVPTKEDEPIEDVPLVSPNSGAIDARGDFENTNGDGGSGGPAKGGGGPDGLLLDETIPPPDVPTFVEEFPEVVKSVRPAYPEMARAAGLEGRVIVRMFVGVDGKIWRAEIERSSPMFDEAALEAARQWVFTPAKTNGYPVGVWVRVPIDFRLH